MSSLTLPLIRPALPVAVCCAVIFGGTVACRPYGSGSPPEAPTPANRVEIAEGDRTGARSHASAQAREDARVDAAVRVEDLLVGRFPGVEVRRTADGGVSVRIRSGSTLSGSGEPLYVVDGVEVFVVPGRGLDWLNPADVAHIQVLKDAVSTTMYGMRGGNGVILITTRRGR